MIRRHDEYSGGTSRNNVDERQLEIRDINTDPEISLTNSSVTSPLTLFLYTIAREPHL